MRDAYRRAMDALYLVCVGIAGVAMVIMTGIIPYGVFTRYVLNSASSWPEPTGVLLMIVFTFLGGAACYRAGIHIAVQVFTNMMPQTLRTACTWIVFLMLAILNTFIIVWGISLVEVTWHQVLAELTWLRVGIAYLPVPISGGLTLLFLIELAWLGPPGEDSVMHREPISAN